MYCRASATLWITSSWRITPLDAAEGWDLADMARVGRKSLKNGPGIYHRQPGRGKDGGLLPGIAGGTVLGPPLRKCLLILTSGAVTVIAVAMSALESP